MGEKVILDELKYIHKLLVDCQQHMEEISRPKAGTVFWRLFFPAGQFSQSKSAAKAAAAILALIDDRLNDMVKTLQKHQHPLTPSISELLNLNLKDMAEKLAKVPEREQYIQPQVENLKNRIEEFIRSFQ